MYTLLIKYDIQQEIQQPGVLLVGRGGLGGPDGGEQLGDLTSRDEEATAAGQQCRHVDQRLFCGIHATCRTIP